ncbi:4Fe-4S binding protein [Chloroflexota bacterium]
MAEAQDDDIYQRLAGKIGSQVENFGEYEAAPKIFKHLMTPEQAQLADAFPGVSEELATKVGRDLESVTKDLQYLYRLGIGTPSSRTGKWNLPRSPMLFVDKLCTHHRNAPAPFRHLLQELQMAREAKRSRMPEAVRKKEWPNPMTRLVPAYTVVKDKPELQPWESVKGILQMADKIALVDCPCRMRFPGGNNCQLPHNTEVCMLLNRDAEYAVDSGSATKLLTLDEAMKHIERMEKVGMIHHVNNVRGVVSLFCNCCVDHCMAMYRYYNESGSRETHVPSRWRPVVDNELCVGCGVCEERCYFDAISRKRDNVGELKAVIDPDLCVGCGSCVVGCPHGALDMECVHPEEWVPGGLGTRPGEARDLPQYANL